MQDLNPYEAPAAFNAFSNPRQLRYGRRQVKAVLLLALLAGVDFVRCIAFDFERNYLLQAVRALIFAIIGYFFYCGHRWARFLLAAFSIVGIGAVYTFLRYEAIMMDEPFRLAYLMVCYVGIGGITIAAPSVGAFQTSQRRRRKKKVIGTG